MSKYRTPELLEEIAGLLSIKDVFRRFGICVLAAVVGAALVIVLVNEYAELSRIPMLATCGYALLVCIAAGAAAGLLRIGFGMLNGIGAVLKLVLKITDQAAADHESIQSGQMQMLSGPELSRRVFEDVVKVGVEKVLNRSFGFLATPMRWVYSRVAASTAERFFTAAANEQSTAEPSARGTRTVESIARHSERIRRYTPSASGIVATVTRAARIAMFGPALVIFSVTLGFALIPVAWIILNH
ncbi:MAG: hypothetical protein KDA89_04630 [Planctomycetaceae bacterium]|nr:hypothetical protein [Planctomycetaceae bacterium]